MTKLHSLGILLAFFACFSSPPVQAQAMNSAPPPQTPPAPLVTPEVHPDHTVTFRFRAPGAQAVQLAREGAPAVPMRRDDAGVWSVTTAPLPPDYYGYSIVVDGQRNLDPYNPLFKPNLLSTENMVHVPGPASAPWESNEVPHGAIHHHYYRSAVAADDRDYYVYTPPNYDPRASAEYPVLYLLHGYSDDASGWTAVGRANVILDNLIARGQAKPMIVVMPLGYGTMKMITGGWDVWDRQDIRTENFSKFQQALLGEVMPQVESGYRVAADRDSRAIAGLSMGGAESLLTGLNHADRFAWIGAFSSGGLPEPFDRDFPGLGTGKSPALRLLWIACGTEDGLIDVNRRFHHWLESKGIEHGAIETPGMHSWMVWRRNLAAFLPLLFR